LFRGTASGEIPMSARPARESRRLHAPSLGSVAMRLPRRYDGVARPIVTYGSDPVLHRPCAPVTEFDEPLRRLLLDMFASMAAADGVGLAANQIGVDARIFVIDCPDADGEDVVGYVINPTLTVLEPREGEPAEEVTEEGCLSVPGPYAELPRAFRARVDGVDVKGNPVSIEATGMAARCLQHEMDHLEGTVYVDLLSEELREHLLAEAAGPSGDLPA
jgi:peptide deformylase